MAASPSSRWSSCRARSATAGTGAVALPAGPPHRPGPGHRSPGNPAGWPPRSRLHSRVAVGGRTSHPDNLPRPNGVLHQGRIAASGLAGGNATPRGWCSRRSPAGCRPRQEQRGLPWAFTTLWRQRGAHGAYRAERPGARGGYIRSCRPCYRSGRASTRGGLTTARGRRGLWKASRRPGIGGEQIRASQPSPLYPGNPPRAW